MSTPRDDADHIGRRTPAKGVIISSDMPTILFCTVCADTGSWVAQASVKQTLHKIWQHTATAWLVGGYVLMPDHLNFLCCPKSGDLTTDIERWTAFWKDRFAKETKHINQRWQRGVFHTRMRSDSHLHEKLDYVRDNPVAKGIVSRPEDWPWRGQVHDLAAHIRSIGNSGAEATPVPIK